MATNEVLFGVWHLFTFLAYGSKTVNLHDEIGVETEFENTLFFLFIK